MTTDDLKQRIRILFDGEISHVQTHLLAQLAEEYYQQQLLNKGSVSGSLELLQRELNRITANNAAKEAVGENYNCLNTLGVRNAIKLIEKLSANDH